MFEQTFKNIDDILHKDAGCGSELDYVEQTSWILFLKYLDDLDKDRATAAELTGKTYLPIIDRKYEWTVWAMPKTGDGKPDHHNALTGDDLSDFVNNKLFPYWNKTNIINEPPGEWGGPWTEKKLEAFSKYVWSYLTIMKKFSYWKTIYFDGFAGSGAREMNQNTDLMQQLKISEEEVKTYKGAAERVLGLQELGFDYYYFIDKKEESLKKLQAKLDKQFKEKTIVYRSGDANHQLADLAKALKTKDYAALIFLDPFGMQIDWDSIAELKGTRSDVWILVPTGVIVNRLLDRAGKLEFSDKLQSFFGLPIEEIRTYFYKEKKVQTLFGEEEIITKVSRPIEKIARLYAERMKTIWKHVTDEPLVLKNRNGVPIFHFVFASNNQNAKKIAKQIIQNI